MPIGANARAKPERHSSAHRPRSSAAAVNTVRADISGSSSASSNTAWRDSAWPNAVCTANTMSNFETTTNSMSAPQRSRANSTVSGPGSAVAINEPAVAPPPRHGQPAARRDRRRPRCSSAAVGRLAHQIDERQIEILREGLVVEPRVDPVARQQRVAKPHIPPFGESHSLVELRQRDDAPADQKIAERAIGGRERHGLARPGRAGRRRNMRCSANRRRRSRAATSRR